ncbi:MAG: PHP domain-containing protein, partial [Niameybacter sp.]
MNQETEIRSFFEVLPELKVDDKLHQLFKDIVVEKVVFDNATATLAIHMRSRQIIHFANIEKMQNAIKDKLFPTTELSILLNQQYLLSEQYTLKYLVDEYKSSLLYEIGSKSEMFSALMRLSGWEVEGDTLTVTLDNSLFARRRSEEIKKQIHEIFINRFDMNVQIVFDFRACANNSFTQENETKLAREVHNVMGNVKHTPKGEEEPRKQEEERKPAPKKYTKQPADPDVFYGRSCDGEVTHIDEIQDEIGEVVIQGQVIGIDTREIRMEKTIIMFDITDFTDTITVKLFVKNEDLPDIMGNLKKGGFYRIKGMAILDKYDKEVGIGSVQGIKPIADYTSKRMDISDEKRVELHLHTTMSDMDSVVDIKKMVNRAKAWGMPAIAITDHGCLQAFPIANHCVSKDEPFKIIYGVEAYFVDDMKEMVVDSKNQNLRESYVVFDLETTGFSAHQNRIIEIGAVKVVNGEVVDQFSEFVNPQVPIPYEIENLTGIKDHMVMDAPTIETILPQFLAFCEGSVMVAHNADFDMSFIHANAEGLGLSSCFTVLDTVGLARVLMPTLGNFKLNNVAKRLGISLENHHRAVDDATATGEIFIKFIEMLEEKEVHTLDEINHLVDVSPEYIKKLPTYHGIILVKNEIGRINLNRLVSASHLDYFQRRPRMPKSLIQKYREGLIIGSACEAGEVFQAILREKDETELARIASFYDYLEIQPIGNNSFMLRSDKYAATTKEDLMDYNRKIVELGESHNKPVVATCDVHFLDPEDEVYRRIIM